MAISDGQRVNATNSNAAWMSRTVNTSTSGKVDLQNTDPASGTSQTNVQAEMNGQNKFVGRTANTGKDSLPTWTNNNYGTVSDDLKARTEAHDAAIAANENRLDGHDTDIADLVTLSGEAANSTDHGTFSGATIPDASTTHGALQSLETAVELRELASNKGIPSGYASLDSGGKVPTSELPDTVLGTVQYQGTWNATTNIPDLPASSPEKGDYYVVAVAGSTSLGGITDWEIGDWAIFNGTIWEKVDNTDQVDSVNGQTGIVVLDTDDVSEGATNKYYSTSLFDTDFATKDTDDLSEGTTNKYYASSLFSTDFATKDTDDLTEGTTNKYATDATIDARIAAASINDLSDVDTSTTPPTDGQTLIWDNANSVWEPGDATGGSGQGGINYLVNPSGETDASDWAGSGAGVTVSSETTTPIRGSKSIKLSKDAANRQNSYWDANTSAIDLADISKPLTVRFEYFTSTNFVSSDVEWFLYDVTNATEIRINATADFNGKLGSTGGSNDVRKFIGQVYLSTSSSYKLRAKILTTSALSYDIVIDDVWLTPESFYNMPIVAPGEAWTPTGSWTTNTTYTGSWDRDGRYMTCAVNVYLSGSPTAANLTINLPSGHTIDTTVLPSGTEHLFGTGVLLDSSVGRGVVFIRYANTSSVKVQILKVDSTSNVDSLADVSNTFPATLVATDRLTFSFRVPITQWANSSTVMSTTQANLQTVKARAYRSAAQSVANSTTVKIQLSSESFDNHSAFDSTTNYRFTAPVSGTYRVDANIVWLTNATGVRGTLIYKNGTAIATSYTSGHTSNVTGATVSTTVQLDKGDYLELYGFQDSGGSLDTFSSSSTTFMSVSEEPDFTTIGVYSPYEVKSAASSVKTPTATATFSQMTGNSLTLTPGTWSIQANCRFANSGTTPTYNYLEIGLYGANGADNGTTPAYIGSLSGVTVINSTISNAARQYLYVPSSPDAGVKSSELIISNTGTISVYAVPYHTSSTPANARVTTYFNARRIK